MSYIDVDRWHSEAERHAVRDALSIAALVAVCYVLFMAFGYYMSKPIAVQEKPELSASEPYYEPPAEEKKEEDLPEPEAPGFVEKAYAEEKEPAIPVLVETAVPVMEEQEPQAHVEPASYSPNEFKQMGVVYDEGTRYTWYSQNVLPGGGLDIPGRHVDGNGYVADSDGRIAVASSDHPIGTELDTPFGPATVYDTGCANGTVDIYTNF